MSRGVAIINVRAIVCKHSRQVSQLEVLVLWIKVGAAQDQDRHFSAGSMANPRRDQNRSSRCDRVPHPVENDCCVGLTLQNHVHLGVFTMVVFLRVLADLGQVHRSRELVPVRERPPGHPAGTCHRW